MMVGHCDAKKAFIIAIKPASCIDNVFREMASMILLSQIANETKNNKQQKRIILGYV